MKEHLRNMEEERKRAQNQLLPPHPQPPQRQYYDRSWQQVPRHQFQTDLPWQQQPSMMDGISEMEKSTPIALPTMVSAIQVPLAYSMVSGGLAAILSALVIVPFELMPGYASLVIGLIVFALAWIKKTDSYDQLLVQVERITGIDHNNDGVVGEAKQIDLNIGHTDANGNAGRQLLANVRGVAEETFEHWATCVVNGTRGLSEAEWTGSGNPFSKPVYKNFLNALGEGGIVAWKNENAKNQGRILTDEGREALTAYLSPTR